MDLRHVLFCSALFVLSDGHWSNRQLLKTLKVETDTLMREYDTSFELFTTTETKVNEVGTSQTNRNSGGGMSDTALLDRLKNVEDRVRALVERVKRGKTRDGPLRGETVVVLHRMSQTITATAAAVKTLGQEITEQLDAFKGKISAAHRDAQVKISSLGGLMYGGIGTPCSADAPECTTADSECRGDKCQCSLGLSYDHGQRKCVGSCATYGRTFQTAPRRVIREYNDRVVNSTSLADCASTCVDETSFTCRSFDYFPDWRQCFLSRHVKSDVDDAAWEYNDAGYHFQRDCDN